MSAYLTRAVLAVFGRCHTALRRFGSTDVMPAGHTWDEMTVSTSEYDHNKRAGNRGDVVKHPALIAALEAVIDARAGTAAPLRFADTFAGYADNPLRDEAGYGWKKGVGQLDVRALAAGPQDALARWAGRYLSAPELAGTLYPGSSRIAHDACTARQLPIRLAMWDVNERPLQTLRAAFGGGDHRIHARPATPDEEDVERADFVFIDPPGVGEDKGYPRWETFAGFLDAAVRRDQHLLMWLPVNADTTTTPPSDDQGTARWRAAAVKRGLGVTKVRYLRGGHTVGCQLVYRLPREAVDALRATVRRAAGAAGWDLELAPTGLPVLVHYP